MTNLAISIAELLGLEPKEVDCEGSGCPYFSCFTCGEEALSRVRLKSSEDSHD